MIIFVNFYRTELTYYGTSGQIKAFVLLHNVSLSKIIYSCGRIGLFPFAGEFQFNGSKAEKDTSSTNTSDTQLKCTWCGEFSVFIRFCCTFRFVSLSVLPRGTLCSIWKILNFYSHFMWKRLYILIAREKTLLLWTKKKYWHYIISCCNNCYMECFNFNITTFAQLNFTFFTNLRTIVANRTLVGSVNDITPQTMIYLLHLGCVVRVLIGDDAWHDLGDSIKSTWDLGTYGKSKIYVEEASVSLFV